MIFIVYCIISVFFPRENYAEETYRQAVKRIEEKRITDEKRIAEEQRIAKEKQQMQMLEEQRLEAIQKAEAEEKAKEQRLLEEKRKAKEESEKIQQQRIAAAQQLIEEKKRLESEKLQIERENAEAKQREQERKEKEVLLTAQYEQLKKVMATPEYDGALQKFIFSNKYQWEEIFFEGGYFSVKSSSFSEFQNILIRNPQSLTAFTHTEMEWIQHIFFQKSYIANVDYVIEYFHKNGIYDNLQKFAQILYQEEIITGCKDESIYTLSLWAYLCEKSVEMIGEKFAQECKQLDDESVSTWQEGVTKYFELVDDDTVLHSQWRLFHYLRYKKIIPDGIKLDVVGEEYCRIFPDAKKKQELRHYKESLFTPATTTSQTTQTLAEIIASVDNMDGYVFEEFVGKLFGVMGYRTSVTKQSNDQGVDVIAEKDGEKLGIQAKRYSSSVSNSAIQEIVAGKNMYNLTKLMVITNNTFTSSAKELAKTNDVILWDRTILLKKIEEYHSKLS